MQQASTSSRVKGVAVWSGLVGTCAAGTGEGEVMKNGLEGGRRVGKCVRQVRQ